MPSQRPTNPNDALRQARQLRGWSQEEVAERVGTNGFTVSRWELGQSFPSPYYRQQLSTLFDQPPEALGLVPARGQPASASHAPQSTRSAASIPGSARVVEDPLLPLPAFLPTGLIGRDPLLAQLKARLLNGQTLVISALQGLPGVGKTALALALAHDAEVRAHFADGFLWAGLGQTPHIQETLARWGTLLGLIPAETAKLATTEAWAQALRGVIGERRLLFVLDDAWQVEAVLAYQIGGVNCASLVTTRRLDLALQVAGTELATVPELGEAEGLTLLTQFAPQVVAAEPEEARALVQAVGGLPLGLVLVGKYLTLPAYANQPRRIRAALERLHNSTERLRLAQPQAPAEPHPNLPAGTPLSLSASIGLSEAALSQEAQAMLRALSVFPPKPINFSEEAALSVTASTAETLDQLVDAGLVEPAGPGRYALHQTIVDYARQQSGHAEAEERLVTWAVEWLARQVDKTAVLDQELPLLLVACTLAGEHGFRALLVRGVLLLAPLLDQQGHFETAERILEEAQRAAQASGDLPGQVQTMSQLAQVLQKRGAYVQAEALLAQGVELARGQGADEHLIALLQVAGIIARRRGAREQAERAFQEALVLARASGDEERITSLLISLGSLAIQYGDLAQAEAFYQEALHSARTRGHLAQIATVLQGLAGVAAAKGDYQQARARLQETLAIARSGGSRDRMVWLLNNLGVLEMDQGNLGEAERALVEGLAMAREMGYQDVLALVLESLGEVLLRSRRYQEAYVACQEALALAQALGQRERTGSVLLLLAEITVLEGDVPQAEGWLQKGQLVAHELQQPLLQSHAQLIAGDLEVQREHWEAAATAFGTVAASDPQSQRPEYLALAHYGLAKVAAGQGNWPEAAQYGQASLARMESMSYYMAADVRQWLLNLPLSVPNRDTTGQEQS